MTPTLADEVLALVRARVGFSQRFLARAEACRAVERCFAHAGVQSAAEYVRRLRGDPALLAAVIDALTVSESHFMRDPALFAFLALHFFGEARQPGERPLSMWSAGCAAGEELYSFAMLCKDQGQRAPLRLLGTDVSHAAIERAGRAEYGRWALRGLGPSQLTRHFELLPSGKQRVKRELRRHARFQVHSLVSEFAPSFGNSAFDLVLCRNVLIYIEADRLSAAARTLASALAPGALLITGPSDPALPSGILAPPTATPFGLVYRASALAPLVVQVPAIAEELSGLRLLTQAPLTSPASAESELAQAIDVIASEPPAAPAANTRESEPTFPPAPRAPSVPSAASFFRAAAKAVEEGDDGAAEVNLRKALYLDDELVLAHLLGGWLCKRRGDTRGLERAFARVLGCVEGQPPDDEVPHGEGLRWVELERIARSELMPDGGQRGASR